jgi:hypothetical protein
MGKARYFDELPVLGAMGPKQAAAKLRELHEEEAAALIEAVNRMALGPSATERRRFRWPFEDRAWQHTTHTFGYLGPVTAEGDRLVVCQNCTCG